MCLYLAAYPDTFATDEAKFVCLASYLRDRAYAWIERFVNDPECEERTSFDKLKASFLQGLGQPDRQFVSSTQIWRLRQTQSANDYVTEFFKLSSQLTGYGEEALKDILFNGLRNDVQLQITHALAADPARFPRVADMASFAVQVDNRLQVRRSMYNTLRGPFSQRPGPQASPLAAPLPAGPVASQQVAPMELDATNAPYRPQTVAEKQRRRDQRLCLYCADPHHLIAQCPARPNAPRRQNPAHFNATAPTSPGPASEMPPTESAKPATTSLSWSDDSMLAQVLHESPADDPKV